MNERAVMGDVVRARLDALLAELGPPPDEGLVEPDAPPGDDEPPEAGAAPTDDPGPARSRGRPDHTQVWSQAWEFGRRHLTVIGVIALVGLIGAVYSLTQAQTVPVASASPSPVPASVTPSPTPTPEPLRVHVLGAVASPGVVSLPPGARVEDAVAAAGGLRESARPGDLNLAAPLADGVQIVIGDTRRPGGEVRAGESGSGAGGGAGSGQAGGTASATVDLNAATAEQLEGLPGVGPVTAQAILAWRTAHQRFSRVEELQEVDGIGPKTYARLAPLVRV